MNYAEMKNHEINAAVGEAMGWNAKFIHQDDSVTFRDDLGRLRGRKNYCNSWADAGPIIVENKISLSNAIIRWNASSLVYDDKFDAGFKIYRSDSGVDSSSRGALRAAMIVFLMMQESK